MKNTRKRKLPDQISKEGASLQQALSVLKSDEVNAGGVLETIMTRDFRARTNPQHEVYYEVWRCIDEYLSNGLPIIINIDTVTFKNNHRKKNPEVREQQNNETAHFILILGMHLLTDPEEEDFFMRIAQDRKWDRIDRAESPGRLIVHDTRQGPYIEEHTMDVLSSAWQEDGDRSGISMLAITPRGTRIGIYRLRAMARNLAGQEPDAFWKLYISDCFPMLMRTDSQNTAKTFSRSQVDELRYVVRLLRTTQVIRRYLITKNKKRLQEHEPAKQYIEKVSPPADGWWWAVEVTLPWRATIADSNKHKHRQRDIDSEVNDLSRREERPPAIVYLWHNTDSDDSSPRATIRYLSKGNGGDKQVSLSVIGEEEEIRYVMSPQRA